MAKLRIAVHKFTSCDGCQLAFLNAGEALLVLAEQVELVHFIEAGMVAPEAEVDISFVEGSISTLAEEERIQRVRQKSRFIITIGACATAGGVQALRNAADYPDWLASVYASPQFIQSLDSSTAIAKHVRVDWELWGCPVNSGQVLEAIHSLTLHAAPEIKRDAVCLECKRKNQVCVMVAKNEPCMGPVTQTGCGALCPGVNRACYACYGPSENPNNGSLGGWFKQQGLTDEKLVKQFQHINNQAPAFAKAAERFKGINIKVEK